MAWDLGVILCLIVFNGFLAMSEFAVVASKRTVLRHVAKAGARMARDAGKARRARRALRLYDDPGRFLATIQVGITLIGVMLGVIGHATLVEPFASLFARLPVLSSRADTVASIIVVVAVTYLTLVIGELVPKRIGLARPEAVAGLVAFPMILLSRMAAPAVWLLRHSTDLALGVAGFGAEKRTTITEDEVRQLVAEGTETGVFEPVERRMIEGVLSLADREARTVMTPRPDMVSLFLDSGEEEMKRVLAASNHSRLPVFRTEGGEELLGVVQTKDVLDRALRGEPFEIAAWLRWPLIVHEGVDLLSLIELFRESSVHMALLVDEYGAIKGLVTATDVLQAIAGHLPERDTAQVRRVTTGGDGTWLVSGSMAIHAVERRFGLSGLASGKGYNTIAGFLLDRLGHVPDVGESIVWQGVRYDVAGMRGRRITLVRIVLPQPGDTVCDRR